MIDLLFNLLLLLFWVRLPPPQRFSTYYNPYVAWINQASRTVLREIRRLLPQLSQARAAALVLLLVLVLRAFVMLSEPFAGWTLRFGFEQSVSAAGFWGRLVFSASSFGIMLFYLWAAYAALANGSRGGNAVNECLTFITRPISHWLPKRRWLAVGLLGLTISFVLAVFARSLSPGIGLTFSARFPLRMLVNTAVALTGLLPVIRTLLMAAIIGSWIALLTPADSLSVFCGQIIAFLMGPLRRYRLDFGMLDLMPLLVLVMLHVVHELLLGVLAPIYRATLI